MTSFEGRLAPILNAGDVSDLLAPHLLPLAQSGWHELVPLAHWLVKKVAPRTLVELGTHAGVSFSAFCSAIARNGLPTKAFAIDTWRGDDHAGFYDDRIYEDVAAMVSERFPSFATLMRKTFDAGAASFADKSIDLLHIDGFHSYDAVKHDYETWVGKVSDRGVIVFHDVNVHRDGFGVWRFWEEISRAYPSFTFLHGHGLGVLAVGGSPPAAIAALTGLTEPADIDAVRTVFAAAGATHGRVFEQHLQCEQRVRDALDAAIAARPLPPERPPPRVQDLEDALAAARAEAAEAHARLAAMEGSTSWRMSAPVRGLRRLLPLNDAQVALLKTAAGPGGADARRVLTASLRRRAGLKPQGAPTLTSSNNRPA